MTKKIGVILSNDPDQTWSMQYDDPFLQNALLMNEEFAGYVEKKNYNALQFAILMYMQYEIKPPSAGLRVEYIDSDEKFFIYRDKQGIEQIAIIPDNVAPRIFTAAKFDPDKDYGE